MDSDQIKRILKKCPQENNCFIGVFSCDKLPKIKKIPCCFIANTDPSYLSGEHWIAIYVVNKSTADYFDSFGQPPENKHFKKFLSQFQNYNYNSTCIQGSDTTVCGQYCVIFLISRQIGYEMDLIIERLHANENVITRDVAVCALVNALADLNLPVADIELLL